MSKRQWIWLIVALAVFVAAGVFTAWNTNQKINSTLNSLSTLQTGIAEMSSFSAFPQEEFIARLDIEGTIMSDSGSAALLASSGFDEDAILDYIDRLIDCPQNIGILLYIDSGGGQMNASDEIYLRLMDYKHETGRPIYAYFDSTACSGAYYIAMAADEIWANRNCICVNIGVYIQTYNLTELFDKYGIEEVMIRSSENKGIGSMGQPWTDEQLAIYQSIVDLYYDQFLEVVAEGRGMTKEQVKQLDDGREMLAVQAYESGFIDGIGRYEEYLEDVLSRAGDPVLYEESAPEMGLTSLFDYLYGQIRSLVPVSDGRLLQEFVQEHDDIVVMAYAN